MHPNAIRLTVLLTLSLWLGGGAAAFGQADEKEALKERFRQRYAKLLEAKKQGLIGETAEGFVAAVEDRKLEGALRELVEAETTDRKKLYQIIAAETPGASPEVVAARNAQRNFEKAEKGHYLRDKDGKWRRKGGS